jgi:hypothetical protein
MGREVRCRVRRGDQVGVGKALLETDEVVFRGEFRLRVPFWAMTRVEAIAGQLEIDWPEGTAVFELGSPEADRWVERITNPPSLMDKLGVKRGARVAVLNLDDEEFWKDLRTRTDAICDGEPSASCEVVVWAVEDAAELAGIPDMEDWIRPNGALWMVWPKGRKELTENHIRNAALAAGLVDVKVARFSATHSALKLVIRKARRGG